MNRVKIIKVKAGLKKRSRKRKVKIIKKNMEILL